MAVKRKPRLQKDAKGFYVRVGTKKLYITVKNKTEMKQVPVSVVLDLIDKYRKRERGKIEKRKQEKLKDIRNRPVKPGQLKKKEEDTKAKTKKVTDEERLQVKRLMSQIEGLKSRVAEAQREAKDEQDKRKMLETKSLREQLGNKVDRELGKLMKTTRIDDFRDMLVREGILSKKESKSITKQEVTEVLKPLVAQKLAERASKGLPSDLGADRDDVYQGGIEVFRRKKKPAPPVSARAEEKKDGEPKSPIPTDRQDEDFSLRSPPPTKMTKEKEAQLSQAVKSTVDRREQQARKIEQSINRLAQEAELDLQLVQQLKRANQDLAEQEDILLDEKRRVAKERLESILKENKTIATRTNAKEELVKTIEEPILSRKNLQGVVDAILENPVYFRKYTDKAVTTDEDRQRLREIEEARQQNEEGIDKFDIRSMRRALRISEVPASLVQDLNVPSPVKDYLDSLYERIGEARQVLGDVTETPDTERIAGLSVDTSEQPATRLRFDDEPPPLVEGGPAPNPEVQAPGELVDQARRDAGLDDEDDNDTAYESADEADDVEAEGAEDPLEAYACGLPDALLGKQVKKIGETIDPDFTTVCFQDEIAETLKPLMDDNVPRMSLIYNTTTSPDADKPVEQAHYIALVIDNDKERVMLFDPLAEELNPIVLQQITQLLESTPTLYKIKVNTVQSQSRTTSNCAYHCLAFLQRLAEGDDFATASMFNKVNGVAEGETQAYNLKKQVEKFEEV